MPVHLSLPRHFRISFVNHAVIATNEGIVVIGGKARKGTTLDCVEFLDLANGATEWSTDKYPQLPSKRSTACAVYDPKGQTIYVFGMCHWICIQCPNCWNAGGDDETGTILADGWKLDLNKQDDGWVAMPSMREPRTMFGMVSAPSHSPLVIQHLKSYTLTHCSIALLLFMAIVAYH